MISAILFWFSAIALIHTYLFYPLLVRLWAKGRKLNTITYTSGDEFPEISVIMAVHNAESMVRKKIESVLNSDYPAGKLTFYIGSDASSDSSNNIIDELCMNYPQIRFKKYTKRLGKIRIINELAMSTGSEILVFTDVYAIFDSETLKQLLRHFKNDAVQLVGGIMKTENLNKKGIMFQETSYFENEYQVKLAESKLWGCMMGAFGSIYAVRRKAWVPVPGNFLSDDFYITLKAIEKGGLAILEPGAVVFQSPSGNIQEEFRRKKRISTGNFQNLSVFYKLLFSSRRGLAFSFFSHKVLRWLGPVFILCNMISLIFLFNTNSFYTILFIIMTLSLLLPIIDYIHVKCQFQVVLLRFITHFFYMNIALLIGMFIYLKGVKSNVWEPTKRN